MGNRNRTIICLLLFAWGEQTNAAPRHFAGYMESADSPQVQFRRLGVTSASTEFGHIIIDFDIHMLDANLQQVIRHMPKQDARLKDKEPHHSFKLDLLHRHAQSLEGRLTTVKLAGVQPTQVNLIREKRFAFTIGIVAVTALLALTAGLYATAEVKAIRRKATQIGAEQKEQILLIEAMLHASQDLAQVVDRIPEMVYTDKFGAEAKVAYFELILQQIGEKIALAENAVRAAALGKLDITTINAAGFTNALYSLRRFADKNSLALVTENLNDFLHVPTSITQSEDGFSLIAHVPLIDPTSTMIVYQHMRLPMPAGEGFFYQLEADTDVIAIHPDESMFKEMSMVELMADCIKLGNFYACPRGNAARKPTTTGFTKDDPGLCLFGIFTGTTEMAATSCNRRIINPGPIAVQTSPRQFTTYGSTKGNVTCRRSQTYTYFESKKFGNINLPPGCVAHTDNFVLSSGDSEYSRKESEWVHTSTLPVDAPLYLQGLNLTTLRALSKDAHHALAEFSSISLTEAHMATENALLKETSPWSIESLLNFGGNWTGSLALFIAILALIISTRTAFKGKTDSNNQTATAPTQTFVNMGNNPVKPQEPPPRYNPILQDW